MKILQLSAENIKRISVVEISPSGNLVEIAGKNGNGKTSVLDSIWWALGSGKAVQSKPIRSGAKKARITLQLGSGDDVELIVERRFTENNTLLKVSTADGASYPKPQAMLDDLLGALTFDPLEFMRADSAKQFEILRGVVSLDVDLDAMAEERAKIYAERTDINRKIKQLSSRLDAMPTVNPITPVDTAAIIERLAKVDEHNAEVRQSLQIIESAKKAAETLSGRLELARMQIRHIEEELKKAKAEVSALEERPIAELVDPQKIRAELATAVEVNKQAEAFRARQALAKEIEEEEAVAQDFGAMIETLEERRRNAIAKADMPIEGLSLGDGEVTYNGVPISQASDAEQLKVSTAIAAALNPKLRVIRVRDGSLLDEDAMKWLAKFADETDMQIWIERVGDGGPGAIILEDGHIKGVEAPASEEQED